MSWLHFLVVEHWRPPVAGLEAAGWQRESVTLIDLVPPLRGPS